MIGRSLVLPALLAALALVTPGAGLRAQTTAPAETADAPPAPVPVDDLPVLERGGNAAAADVARRVLYPLASGTGAAVVRLTGESASETVTLYLPNEPPPGALQLSYRVSINALQDRSSLRLVVNGEPTAAIAPDAFDGFATVSLATAALHPGRNDIRIEATLSHRIFCGPDASFAIWAEIDLAQSGALAAPGTDTPQAGDAAALLTAQAMQPGGLSLRLAPGAEPAAAAALARQIAARLPGEHPVLRQETVWTPLPDGAPAIARLVLERGPAPRVSLLRGSDGALVMRVAYADGPDGPKLPDLGALLPEAPPAAAALPLFTPGAAEPLATVGQADIARSGHYIREDVRFRLPDDWLVLGPQTAEMSLVYGFADHLAKGALLLVKANGTTIQLLPLDRKGGTILPPLRIRFRAALLHPGPNAITFEAIVPGDPPDLPCPATTGPTLQILATSTLDVPATPRMRFPGMETVLGHLDGDHILGPDGNGRGQLGLLSLVVLADRAPQAGAGTPTTLTVLPYGALDRFHAEDLALTRRDLEAILGPAAAPDAARTGTTAPTSLLDRGRRLLDAGIRWLAGVARPGDPPLAQWLAGQRGRLILIQPHGHAPEELVLALGPDVTAADAATALAAARQDPDGPHGRVAILGEDGRWRSWRSSDTPPVLLDQLGPGNLRFVIGTYASWSPLAYTALLLGLTLLSVLIALVFVLTTRGQNKQ